MTETTGIFSLSAERWLLRFLSRIDKTGDCWLWTGAKSTAGYGTFNLGRDPEGRFAYDYAHRLSYELHAGRIPDGLTIDHLCRVKHCVNPAHLEAVTPRENMLRGTSRGAQAHREGRCLQGHTYDRITREGHQRCRICDAAGQRRRWHAKKAAA